MASKKAALGRGLSALLPTQQQEGEAPSDQASAQPHPSKLYRFEDRFLGRVADIEIDAISPNPYQPRKDFEEQALDELAASINQLGIIQPITVRGLNNGRFEVISGERRLRAARRAGLKRVPAYVREADTAAMLEMAIVENVQREDLNPVEVAIGYQRLMEECGLTHEQVAEKVGKSRTTISNFLRLLKLPPRALAALRDGTVSMGHARALISIDDESVQLRLLKSIEADDLSVREVEEQVRRWREKKDAPPVAQTAEEPALQIEQPDRDTLQVQEFANRLRSHFSTQVHIKRRANGNGKIEISFYSDEDLERLMELLQ